jgi:hypothetical protein
MSEAVLLWALGIIVTIVIGLSVAIFNHVKECREPRATLAELKSEMARVKEDIGTHDTGIRGHVHRISDQVGAQGLELELLKRRVDER